MHWLKQELKEGF